MVAKRKRKRPRRAGKIWQRAESRARLECCEQATLTIRTRRQDSLGSMRGGGDGGGEAWRVKVVKARKKGLNSIWIWMDHGHFSGVIVGSCRARSTDVAKQSDAREAAPASLKPNATSQRSNQRSRAPRPASGVPLVPAAGTWNLGATACDEQVLGYRGPLSTLWRAY